MPSWLQIVFGIGAFVISGLGVYIGYQQWRLSAYKLKRDPSARFQSAFAEEITQIDNQDAHSLMSKAKVKHDVAIREFRQWVDLNQLQRFDAAVKDFDQCRSEVTPALSAFYASQASGNPIDNSATVRLKQALNELLAFADRS